MEWLGHTYGVAGTYLWGGWDILMEWLGHTGTYGVAGTYLWGAWDILMEWLGHTYGVAETCLWSGWDILVEWLGHNYGVTGAYMPLDDCNSTVSYTCQVLEPISDILTSVQSVRNLSN